MDTTIDDPLLGALVDGRYRVRARVARGGMATVYTAVDERLERTVAFKIIHPAQANDPRFVERFVDEAKTIARLTHPNVVAVYDQGSHRGLAYLVMEYVRGRTLRELLVQRGQLQPQDALAVLEQMLAAIAAAHRAGLVHRDVKPENVLVAEAPSGTGSLVDCVVKVADFGLAQAVEASADGDGHLMATAAYVAPELVAHGHADPRTDVYSAGIVLFEMLTGRLPYEAEHPVDVAWQHVHSDVPAPSRFAPGLPPSLDALVARATSRDPSGRPTDAGAMYVEVQAVRDELGTAAARGAAQAAQATTVVPRMDSMTATTLLRPVRGGPVADAPAPQTGGLYGTGYAAGWGGTGYAGGESPADRPAWARLPSAKPPPPQPAAPAPHRRAAPSSTDLLSSARSMGSRLLADPRSRLAVVAGLVALVLLVGFGVWWLGAGRYTTSPQLVNLPKDQAIAQARAAGFTVKQDAEQFDEKVAKGVVLSQQPPGGQRIVSGGTITIVVSKGPERYELPDVSGKSFELAQQEFAAMKLQVSRAEVYDDNLAKDTVVATEPPAGTEVKPGTAVTVKVSKGRAPIDVPNVVGKSLGEAQSALQRLGLTVEVQHQDSDQPKDQVISQNPPDGSGAERGAKITLVVSNGPAMVVMPEVRGRNVDEAKKTLEDLGLHVQVIGFGTVRFQNPEPNTQLQPGSQVTILATG